MRIVRFIVAIGFAAGLWSMWSARSWLLEAYQGDREPTDLRLDGVDLAFTTPDVDPSPFERLRAGRPTSSPVALNVSPQSGVPAPVIEGGSSTVSGTVIRPASGEPAPEPGAVVERDNSDIVVVVERHTSGGVARTTAAVEPDGTWMLEGVRGGRYRVRAFVPNQLSSGAATVTFLAQGQAAAIDLVLQPADPNPVLEFHAPPELVIAVDATVAVTVGRRVIDADGRTVQLPLPGSSITFATAAGVVPLSASTVIADSGGAGRLLLRCDVLGAHQITATAQGVGATFNMPPCVEPAPIEEPVDAATEATG